MRVFKGDLLGWLTCYGLDCLVDGFFTWQNQELGMLSPSSWGSPAVAIWCRTGTFLESLGLQSMLEVL